MIKKILLLICLCFAKDNLANYRYPIENILQPADGHYNIMFYDEGTEGAQYYTVTKSEVNSIGALDMVSDENIFYLKDVPLVYAEFNNNWVIKKSVRPVFDKSGRLKN